MLRNYLRSIKAHFRRHPRYFFVNLLGLTVGLLASLLMAQYVWYESSYDRFFTHSNRIVRVSMWWNTPSGYNQHFARVDLPFINQLPDAFPEVEQLVRFQAYRPRNVKVGEDKYRESYAFEADAHVFDVFDYALVAGNAKEALQQPYSVVLTESTARKYFGRAEAMGQEVEVAHPTTGALERYVVRGIMQDPPGNTHLPITLLTSMPNAEARQGWAYTYLLLAPGTDLAQLQAKLPAFVIQNQMDNPESLSLPLQALTGIHLHSDKAREVVPNGNANIVRFFGVVAVLLLVVAAMNFSNLAAARTIDRFKEVGIRKVLGSGKGQLVAFFMTESMALSVVAGLLATVAMVALLPAFNQLAGTQMVLQPGRTALLVVVATGLIGLVAGLYPSLFFTRKIPVQVLRNASSAKTAAGRLGFRQVMLTFQFMVSFALIAGTLISMQQFNYLQSKGLGMQKEQIVAIREINDQVLDGAEALKTAFSQLPGVVGVSAAMEVPSREIRDAGKVTFSHLPANENVVSMDIQLVDLNFVEFMGIELLQGEKFTDRPALKRALPAKETVFDYINGGTRAYLINETAMKLAGIEHPEAIIGQQINWDNNFMTLAKGPVIGVVKDFHQETLRNTVDPLVMVYDPLFCRNILIKIKPRQVRQTLSQIEATWNRQFPDLPFEAVFLDDLFARLYQQEQQQVKLLAIFSGLAIFIAFLGIAGLLTYLTQRRLKEIAIRRVLGATFGTLALMLGSRLGLLGLASALLAAPITLWVMRQWLTQYAYRVATGALPFVVAASLLLVLLTITILWQTRYASSQNPAKVLKQE